MNRTLELQQNKAALFSEATGILKKAETEKRSLTPEERTEVKLKETEMEGINETMALEARISGMASGKNGGSQHGTVVRDLSLEKPFGYEERSGETKEERRYRLMHGFGEQLRAIHHAALNPHRIDTRLMELNKRGTPAGMSEQVPADGGFLVQQDFANEILMIAHDTGNVYTRGRKIPLSEGKNGIKIPAIDETSRADGSRFGGVRAYWLAEADEKTASKPKLREITLTLKKLATLFYATDELLEDATAIGALITQAFGEEIGFKMDDAAINGDGAGKPQGILNSPALVTVAKETGQVADTFVFLNAVKMWSRLWPRSRRNAVWFVNPEVDVQLFQMYLATGGSGSSVVAGVGFGGTGAAYVPAGFNGAEFATLFGRPVIPIEQAAAVGDVGDVILADMTQWIYIDKGAPQQATSIHVRFTTDETAFRSVYRVDGQGWWNAPLTPYKGGNTYSPFVALAARA